MITLLAERLLILGVAGWLAVWFWQRLTWQQQQQKLAAVFYDLLRHQNGKITLIQLVAQSQIEPEITRLFLMEKAQFFGAVIDTDNDGNDYYQFPPI
ncbi:hypothetical protein [Gloeomargarita lithophora]|uniref:hypothetical protein n=1 Tax=Gloeomargarita lithophora TaxID=1188228 RepID=UPI003F7065A8